MVKVDKEKCIGCGTCQSICPEIFEIDDNGKAKLKLSITSSKRGQSKAKIISRTKSSCIKEAIENCPMDAISE